MTKKTSAGKWLYDLRQSASWRCASCISRRARAREGAWKRVSVVVCMGKTECVSVCVSRRRRSGRENVACPRDRGSEGAREK
eukprot:485773-Rhodomonas_salina.1